MIEIGEHFEYVYAGLLYSGDVERPGVWLAEGSSEPHEAVLPDEKVNPLNTLVVLMQPTIIIKKPSGIEYSRQR